MTRRISMLVGALTVVALAGWAPDALAITLYSQSNVIRGPEGAVPCAGAIHGRCAIAEIAEAGGAGPVDADDIQVNCSLRNAAASTTFNVFWVCTNVARGCHGNACGFVDIGDITTDATGTGDFATVLDDNPFPGNWLHFDICVPFCGAPLFTGVYGAVPVGVAGIAPPASAPLTGDPTWWR